MKLKSFLKTAQKLLITVLIVGIPIVLVSYFILFENLSQRKKIETERVAVFSEITKQMLISHLQQIETALDGAALSLDEKNKFNNIELLKAISLKNHYFEYLFLTDQSGEIIVSSNEIEEEFNFSGHPFFEQAINAKTSVSELFIYKINGEETFVVAVPYCLGAEKAQGIIGAVTRKSMIAEIINQIPLPMGSTAVVFDQNGRIIYHPFLQASSAVISPEMEEILTKIREEENGTFWELEGEHREKKYSYYSQIQGTGWGLVVSLPYRVIHRVILFAFLRNLLIYIVCLIFVYIAYQNFRLIKNRELEEEKQKLAKLTLIGELAAGVAHEIRNPLTAVKGFLQLAGPEGRLPEEYYRIMEEQIEMMEGIINELLLLSNSKGFKLTKIDIVQLLEESVRILRGTAFIYKIEIEVQLPQNTPLLIGDQDKLRQVFINLGRNAIEAMKSGGKLNISAVLNEQNGIVITFKDTGPGITEEVLARLGSPFLSTKERGTGLGLLISSRIIQNHRGKLTLSNHSEGGALVTIYLPFAL